VTERELREQMALHGKSLYDRGFTCGSSGNISVRLPDGLLITPTNSCLGRLDPERIAKVRWDGTQVAGAPPSKEAFLHRAVYQARPLEQAVVHLHSTYSVAVSCLNDVDPRDVLPPITAYYVMRVGRLPLIGYYSPGDLALANEVQSVSRDSRAVLLANHGPVVAAADLDAAVYAAEELEETAKLFLLLHGRETRFLTPEQCQELNRRFPS